MGTLRFKRFISCLVTVILLVSGMYIKLDNVHSYFACESKKVSEEIYTSSTQLIISVEYCIEETLQRVSSHSLRNNSANRISFHRIKSTIQLTPSLITKHNFLYLQEYQLTKIPKSISNQAVIIDFIHRQDGAK